MSSTFIPPWRRRDVAMLDSIYIYLAHMLARMVSLWLWEGSNNFTWNALICHPCRRHASMNEKCPFSCTFHEEINCHLRTLKTFHMCSISFSVKTAATKRLLSTEHNTMCARWILETRYFSQLLLISWSFLLLAAQYSAHTQWVFISLLHCYKEIKHC